MCFGEQLIQINFWSCIRIQSKRRSIWYEDKWWLMRFTDGPLRREEFLFFEMCACEQLSLIDTNSFPTEFISSSHSQWYKSKSGPPWIPESSDSVCACQKITSGTHTRVCMCERVRESGIHWHIFISYFLFTLKISGQGVADVFVGKWLGISAQSGHSSRVPAPLTPSPLTPSHGGKGKSRFVLEIQTISFLKYVHIEANAKAFWQKKK